MDASKKLWLNIFARQKFRRFNGSLLRRGLAGLGVNDYGPRQQAAEHWLLDAMLKKLPKDAVVFDVGAHTGAYAGYLAQRRQDLRIHAFEPNPIVFEKLKVNAGGRYKTYEYALGDKGGVSLLHDPKPDGGSECASLVGEAVDGLYKDIEKRTILVSVRTLDEVAKELGVQKIDFLKIDAEGFDLMVLKGAADLIATDRIGIIQFEFNKMNVFSRTFMHDFHKLLPTFKFYRMVQDGIIALGQYDPATWELFGYQNIVCLRDSVLSD